jgi:thiamine kinase-like enzyme
LIVDASVELALKTGYKKIHSYFDETLNELNNIKEVNSFRERYESISDELSNLGFPPVAVHGDFVLYNMQSDSKRLHLIDWEYFREGLPLFDLFHFVFQGKYQIERMNVERSIEAIFSKDNVEHYRYYLNKIGFNANYAGSQVDKIIKNLFFAYLVDNLLFQRKITPDLDLNYSQYFQGLRYF